MSKFNNMHYPSQEEGIDQFFDWYFVTTLKLYTPFEYLHLELLMLLVYFSVRLNKLVNKKNCHAQQLHLISFLRVYESGC